MIPTRRAKNIRDEEIALVREELVNDLSGVGYKDGAGNFRDPKEIARLLTQRPMIDNPVAAPQIPAPLDKTAMYALIKPFVANFPAEALIRVGDAMDSGDRETLGLWVQIALDSGWITQAAFDTIMTAFSSTISDPAWPSRVPGKSPLERVLGRATGISPDEVDHIIRSI